MRLGATRALLLNRWTRHRPIRAEHAAVTIFGLEATAAPRAVIEELAGVGGHRLGGLMPASRARDGGREYHPANLARANRRSRTTNSNGDITDSGFGLTCYSESRKEFIIPKV